MPRTFFLLPLTLALFTAAPHLRAEDRPLAADPEIRQDTRELARDLHERRHGPHRD